MDIIQPNLNFNFEEIKLNEPISLGSGTYFTKLLYKNKPLYIQTPKSLTKQGIVKNGKKHNCELMFDNFNEEFVNWIEHLENKCQTLIYDKSNEWFENSIQLNDIANSFMSTLKIFKSGKYYLLKTFVKTNSLTGQPIIKIYDENEKPLSVNDLVEETNIISILEIEGIKFTNKNFQIEIELKQIMFLNKIDDVVFENCLIKKDFSDNKKTEKNEKTDKIKMQFNNKKTEDEDKDDENKEDKEDKDNNEDNENEDNKDNIAIQFDEIQENIQDNTLEEIQDNHFEEIQVNTLEETKNDLIPFFKVHDIEVQDIKEQDNKVQDIKEHDINEKKDDLYEGLKEVDFENLNNNNHLENIVLKNPNEVYYQMYKEARKKAKEAKKIALVAYLDAKNIKDIYMLNDIDSDESSDNET
jgi:hypothetical protein